MSNRIAINRLTKLKNRLNDVDYDDFNMEHWAEYIVNGKPACGTSACALGWATTVPSLRRAGMRLMLRKSMNGFQKSKIFVGIKGKHYTRLIPNKESLKTAQEIFRIDERQAIHIFLESLNDKGMLGIENTIKRIDSVIRQLKEEDNG